MDLEAFSMCGLLEPAVRARRAKTTYRAFKRPVARKAVKARAPRWLHA
jgi:hypothetical protein